MEKGLNLLPVIGFLLLSACGGGSEGNSVTLLAPQARLSLDSPSVQFTTGSSSEAPAPVQIQFSVVDAPGSALPYKVTFSGAAVKSAALTWSSPSEGTISVQLPDPVSIGKGTYTGVVHLTVCNDIGCTQSIKGSPVDIPVTYIIADATFSFNEPGWRYRATTADTAQQSVSFSLYLQQIPQTGLYIILPKALNGFITGANHRTIDDSSGGVTLYIDLTIASPSSMGSGRFSQNLTIEICYDAECSRQLAGSPITQPLVYSVFLTPGQEYTIVDADLPGTTDLAFDTSNQKIYTVALNNNYTANTGAVAQIDPHSGAVESTRALSEDLSRIAISSDNQYAYAASSSLPVIHRLRLPSLLPDSDIALGSYGDPSTGGGANITGDMLVEPGAPTVLAVSLAHDASSVQSAGTFVFDDALPRMKSLEPAGNFQQADSLAWGDSPESLFAFRYSPQAPVLAQIDLLTIDAAGLSVSSSYPVDIVEDPVGRIAYAAGRIFDLAGYVRDASTGAVMGRIDIPVDEQVIAMVPDPLHGRIFFLAHYSFEPNQHLLCYDITTLAMQSIADLGFDAYDGQRVTRHMITWGSTGVAFNSNGLRILEGTFSASPQPVGAMRSRLGAESSLIRVH